MTDRQPVQKISRPQRRNIVSVNGGAATGTAQKNDDEEFDPPVEMMIHDYDDERTLDEEEALEEPQDPQVEVSTLQRESDMPLEQLLAMYGYGDQGADNMQSSSSETSNHETTPENDEMERVAAEDEVEEKTNHSELQQLYIDHPEKSMDDTVGPARLLRLSRPQSEEDEDYDYIPDEEWRKTIMVGSDFQAAIPEGLCKYDDALPYENDDKLLWNPSQMMEDQIEEFLVKARESLQNNAQGVSVIPTGTHTRDDEQALYLLLQCGYNVEEALRRRRMNAVQPTDTMSLWSEEECTNFENGLRSYGKNFHLIQQNKVRTRSVGELVQFYYLWKKTERHDVFANKARLEKKKYNLHPGITDYMDRFLEEQESGVGTVHRDRSSSPNIHSLIYGDPKRHRVQDSPGETVISATSMSYPVDPLCELASHFDKESMESLVKFAEDGVRNTSASEAGSFAGGAAASSPPAAGTFGSVEMAFSGTTVAAPVVLKAADSEHSSQATESVAQ
ncbi:mesoderm induction early response protein 1 [Bacillus rossius redtenbacheri]|uniref:mesoderm induction early response protein 1 n=1 Tax=Bacillus rossius redtenbacheri TaxID=93214 RepID=UPI002FDC952E